jgi:hypothetical protein
LIILTIQNTRLTSSRELKPYAASLVSEIPDGYTVAVCLMQEQPDKFRVAEYPEPVLDE